MLKITKRWGAALVALMQIFVFLSPTALAAGVQDAGAISVDAAHFPDEAFRNWILDAGNLNGAGSDGILTEQERNDIAEIDVTGQGIADLTGLAYFPALTSLTCTRNQLTALDLSGNLLLEELYCSSNQLSTLDLSANANLKHVYCASNVLTSLNVNGCAQLQSLNCEKNRLASLDLSGNPELLELYCRHNQLTQLDVSQNQKLKFIETFDNQLTSFDCTMLPALEFLHIDYNNLETLDMSRNPNLQGNGFVAANNHLNTLTLPKVSGMTIEAAVFYEQNPKQGYETVRWFSDPQYTQEIQAGDLVQANGQTIYAQWIANPYTVYYNANGGQGEMPPQAVTYDQTFTLSPNTFTWTGYTFQNWNTANNGIGGRSFTDGQEVVNLAGKTPNSSQVTLYAQWKAHTYTIAYDGNGGSGQAVSTAAVYDQPAALAENSFARPGFVFSGWSLTAGDANTVDYLPGASVQNLTAEDGHTVTLYAVWTSHAAIQQPYQDQLTEFFRTYQAQDYYPEDWTALQDIRLDAEAAIAGAEADQSAMQQALQTAFAAAPQVLTKTGRADEIAQRWEDTHSAILAQVAAPLSLDALEASRTLAQTALDQAQAEWLSQRSALTDPASRQAAAQDALAQIAPRMLQLQQMQGAIDWLDSVKDACQTPLGTVRPADGAKFTGHLTAYAALSAEEKAYCADTVVNQLTIRKDFAAEKENALQRVDTYFASLTLTNYTEENQLQLTQICGQAKSDIEAADVIGAADRLALEAVARLQAVPPIQKVPAIVVQPTASALTRGQKLSDSRLTGGQADTAGTFAWKDGSIVPSQTGTQLVVFTPHDSAAYQTVEFYVTVSVTDPAPTPEVPSPTGTPSTPETTSAPGTVTGSVSTPHAAPVQTPAPTPVKTAPAAGSTASSAGAAGTVPTSSPAPESTTKPQSAASQSAPASTTPAESDAASTPASADTRTSTSPVLIFAVVVCAAGIAAAVWQIIRKRRS